jgi:hypothetical protein
MMMPNGGSMIAVTRGIKRPIANVAVLMAVSVLKNVFVSQQIFRLVISAITMPSGGWMIVAFKEKKNQIASVVAQMESSASKTVPVNQQILKLVMFATTMPNGGWMIAVSKGVKKLIVNVDAMEMSAQMIAVQQIITLDVMKPTSGRWIRASNRRYLLRNAR